MGPQKNFAGLCQVLFYYKIRVFLLKETALPIDWGLFVVEWIPVSGGFFASGR